MKDLILTGSIAIDRIMNFPGYFKEHVLPDKVHALNVSFNISSLQERRGGTATNIAYTAALLGGNPYTVGAAGYDFDSYKEYLEGLGITTAYIEKSNELTTASGYITTDMDDNQITAFNMGAMVMETTATLADLSTNAFLLLSPGNKADMLRYSKEALELDEVTIVFDPGQTLPFFEEEELQTLLDRADVLVVNDYEYSMVQNRTGRTHEELVQSISLIIVTKGREGVDIYATASGTTELQSYPACQNIEAVDPTGAGDAFRGGFFYGYANELTLEECAYIGATAASYAVEHNGTQEHTYTMDEFAQRFETQFNKKCPLVYTVD